MTNTITEAELIALRERLAAAKRKAEALAIRRELKEIKSNGRSSADLTLAKLRPALAYGGPLYDGHEATSDRLSTSSRPWRRLLAALRLPDTHPDRIVAEGLLRELDVKYFDGNDAGGKSNRRLFMGPGDTPNIPDVWNV